MGLMDKNRSIAGVNIGGFWDEMDILREELEALLSLYKEGKIKPHVGETFPFTRAADAHRAITERRNVGKVVLVP
jgi:NADPH:quinone reductase-like Zn-dependent oxidoreductase